jgi:Na+/melibiose symporter-like transporter
MGLVPAIAYLGVCIVMLFYRLDKLMPEINKTVEAKKEII